MTDRNRSDLASRDAPKAQSTQPATVAYKAFDAQWKCRDFQYEVGKTYEHEGRVKLCKAGFHAVTVPFDAWNYYPHSTTLARVQMHGDAQRADEDSKIASAKITIEASLSLPEWIRAQVSAVVDLCKAAKGALSDSGHAAATGDSGHAAATGDSGHAAATGDRGHAAATGYRGHAAATGYSGHAAATGDSGHAAATGDSGHAAATGKYGIAASLGYAATGMAGPEGWLVLAHWTDDFKLKLVKAAKVGTEGIEAGKTYRLNAKGKFVEVSQS
jgi:hypothetical protein